MPLHLFSDAADLTPSFWATNAPRSAGEVGQGPLKVSPQGLILQAVDQTGALIDVVTVPYESNASGQLVGLYPVMDGNAPPIQINVDGPAPDPALVADASMYSDFQIQDYSDVTVPNGLTYIASALSGARAAAGAAPIHMFSSTNDTVPSYWATSVTEANGLPAQGPLRIDGKDMVLQVTTASGETMDVARVAVALDNGEIVGLYKVAATGSVASQALMINVDGPAPDPALVADASLYGDFQTQDYSDVTVPSGLTYIASTLSGARAAAGAAPIHMFSSTNDTVPSYWATSVTEANGLPAQGPLRIDGTDMVLQVTTASGETMDVARVAVALDNGEIVGLYKVAATGSVASQALMINVAEPAPIDTSNPYGDFQYMSTDDVAVPQDWTYIGSIDRTLTGAGPLHMFSSTGDAVPSYWATSKTEASGQPAQGPLRVENGTVVLQVLGDDNVPVDVKVVAYAADTSGQIVGLYRGATGTTGGQNFADGESALFEGVDGLVHAQVALPEQVTGVAESGRLKLVMYPDAHTIYVDAAKLNLSVDHHSVSFTIDTSSLPGDYQPYLLVAVFPDGLLTGVSGDQKFAWRVPRDGSVLWDVGDVLFLDRSGNDSWSGDGEANWYDGSTGNDTVDGAGGNDELRGGDGDDEINGGAGDDTLQGGAGNDTLDGGVGSRDLAGYWPDSQSQWTLSRQGLDTLLTNNVSGEVDVLRGIEQISFSDAFINLAPSLNYEARNEWESNNIQGTDYDDVIDADALHSASTKYERDWIEAGQGNDLVNGGAGGDQIVGGAGNDTIDGGDQSYVERLTGVMDPWQLENRVQYSTKAKFYDITKSLDDDGSVTGQEGAVYFTVADTRTDAQDGVDVVFNIDALQFSDKEVRLSPQVWVDKLWTITTDGGSSEIVRGVNIDGNNFGETLGAVPGDGGLASAFVGSDRLNGGHGNDQLYGGAGGDTLRGNKGNDTLNGGANTDAAAEDRNMWTPNGRDGVDVAEYSGKFERYAIERNTDNSFTVTDSKAGGDGEDVLIDVEVLRFADMEVNLAVVGRANYSWDGSTNTKSLMDYNWEGTEWDDSINVSALELTLNLVWRDTVRDGAGDDYINTGGGDDAIVVGEGNDTIDGGTGNDWVSYDAASTRFTITRQVQDGESVYTVVDKLPLEFGGLGTDRITHVESLNFSDGGLRLNVSVNAGGGTQNNIEGTSFGDVINTAELMALSQGADGVALVGGELAVASFAWPGVTLVEGAQYLVKLVQVFYYMPNGAPTITPTTRYNPNTRQQEEISITLTVVDGKLTGEYLLRDIHFGDLSAQLFALDGQNQPSSEPLGIQPLRLTASRDWVNTGSGDDVIFTGDGGDQIQDAAGNDFYDGGADGQTGDSWQDQDMVTFSGARKRYVVETLKYSDLAADSASKALIDEHYTNPESRPSTLVVVTDRLPAEAGGQGVNTLVNVERLQFSDEAVELGVRVNPWKADPMGGAGGWVGTNGFDGGIQGDLIDASQYEEGGALYNPDQPWQSNQDQLQGNDGNDTLMGGAGADRLRGGKGDDVLDGGSNASSPENLAAGLGETYDTAEFSYSIARAVVSFYREASDQDAGPRFDDTGRLATHGAYVKSSFYDPDGFVVVDDRYTAAMGGEGRDVLRDIEALSFSDAWERLGANYSEYSQSNWIWDNAAQQNIEVQVTQRNAWGSRFGDLIQGGGNAQNWLDGQAGDDYLVGGGLRDELVGGAGNDTLDGGGNPDVNPDTPWDTWSTYDVARFSADRAQFAITKMVDDSTVTGVDAQIYYLVEHLIPGALGGLGTDIVLNIERLQFTSGDLQLMPKIEENKDTGQLNFNGSDFWDNITGKAGNDWIDGQSGDDTIAAGAGDDYVKGGAGDDAIDLGAGNDQVSEGAGHDTIDGGAGWDTVKYDESVARYTVQVRASGDDALLATFQLGEVQAGTSQLGSGVYRQSLVAEPGSGYTAYDPTTMYVQVTDSLASSYGGDGVDRLTNVETLSFEDGSLFLAPTTLMVGVVSIDKLQGVTLPDGVSQTDQTDGMVAINVAFAAGDFGVKTAKAIDSEWLNGVMSTDGTMAGDTLVGADRSGESGGPADWLRGWGGNDELQAGLGNDTLEGGRGNDTLIGGAHGSDSWDWNAGDVAWYEGAKARFDIQAWINGSTLVVDLASVKNLSEASFDTVSGHLRPEALGMSDGEVDFSLVSTSVGFGADVLQGVERIRFSDGEINLSVRDDSWTNFYMDPETQEQIDVVRHNYTGSFLSDLILGTNGGDQFDGRGGDDTIDGGVESPDLPGYEWDKLDIVRYEGAKIRYQIEGVLVDVAQNYLVVDAADATGSEVFGLRITDLLPANAGGTGSDLLVNVERVEFAASANSGGDTSISIKPEVNYYEDWSVSVEEGQTRPMSMHVRGTDFSDALKGTPNNDWMSGGAGDDALNGGKGGDEFEGGAGNDTLMGGADSDPDQWGWVRKDVARYNAPMDRFEIESFEQDGQLWLRVSDLLPADDPASLGVDVLRGVESLAFNDRWVDIAVQKWTWEDWRGFSNVNQEGTVFADEISGGTTLVDGEELDDRDFIRGGAGDDVLRGNGNGDEIEGGAGNDLIDGGANGSSGESWSDQDTVRFQGNASQYDVQKLTATGDSTSGALHLGGVAIAAITDGVISFTGSNLNATLVSQITKAHSKFDWFDGTHAQAWVVADHLDEDMGGEGTDIVFNAEQIQFRDGPLELEARVDSSDWNQDGLVDWANVQGTSGNDSLTLAEVATLAKREVTQLTQTRIDIDLRGGDDVYIGGDGGESIRTGAGNDYVDGGANIGSDPWGGQMRDEVRFEGRIDRYNLIDVSLSFDAEGNAVALSTSVPDITIEGVTISAVAGKLTTLVLEDLNAAVANMIIYAPEGASTVQGWLIADRLPAAFEGSGVDALVNVEALAFSDRWLPLEMQVWYNRDWRSEYDEVPWEERPIVGAGVDGTSIGDRIGYNPDVASPVYDYSGDDNLRGNDGDDTIDGGAGGDWISGGQGNDWIDGGANGERDEWGNVRMDQVQYDGEFDRYVITANVDGSITVQDSDSDGDGTDTLWNVEALSFSDRYVRLGVETWVNQDPQTKKVLSVNITGSMLSDNIDVAMLSAQDLQGARHWIDGADGDDILIGGAGPDDLQGGSGDDTIDGGANGVDEWGNPGFDVAHYEGSETRYTLQYSDDEGVTWLDDNPNTEGVWVQVTDSLSADEGGLGVDLLKGIEAIAFWDRFVMLKASRNVLDLDGDGTPDNAEVLGTDGNDSLSGSTTNDRLDGAKGDDTLFGADGGDVLRGGAGDDTLDGGADGLDASGRVLIDVAQYDGNMADYVIIPTESGGFTVEDNATVNGDEGLDALVNIEGIQFADRFVSLKVEVSSNDVNGDGDVDQIEMRGLDLAGAGDNLVPLEGLAGIAYRMMGGFGDDTLSGSALNDVFEGGAGADSITGGEGRDRARYSGDYAEYVVTQPVEEGGVFTVTHGSDGVDGLDTLVSVEELVFADRVYQVLAQGQTATVTSLDIDSDGNRKVDTRFSNGTDGGDSITGQAGLINYIDGGLGNDTLTGGDLGDEFKPGAGNNVIDGGPNIGLDAAGNSFVDRVKYAGLQEDYSVTTLQESRFTISGAVEVGDILSVNLAGKTVFYKATSTDLAATVSAFAEQIQSAVASSDTVFTAQTEVLTGSAVEVVLQGEDMIFAVNPSVANGSQAVSGSFAVEGANQSGSSLLVADASNLLLGMSVSYTVAGSGDNDPVAYGPYKITGISGQTLQLNQSLGASPAAGAPLTVSAANPDTQPTTLSEVTVDRWIRVFQGLENQDELRGIEQIVFGDGVLDLSPIQFETSTWGTTGIESLINTIGTAFADLFKASGDNEVLNGGAGADYFVFQDGNGNDAVADFQAGSQGDVMALNLGPNDSDGLNGTGVNSVAELISLGAQRGNDVYFDLGQGNSVTLTGVRLTDLVDSNFDVMANI
ncbi:hypothetical protein B9Z50_00070 [Limnohabitans sp. Bal53]|nr:hypothetical protein B9Z50_00070 [Limnohabitans sp. Bal53]